MTKSNLLDDEVNLETFFNSTKLTHVYACNQNLFGVVIDSACAESMKLQYFSHLDLQASSKLIKTC